MTLDEMRKDRRRIMDAKGRKRRLLAQLNGQPTNLIDAAPIRARLKQLRTLGYSFESITAMHGAGTTAALRLIEAGQSRRSERKFANIAHLPITLAPPEQVADTMLVPTLGATRRVRALQALGWRHDDITEHIGRASHHLAAGTYPSMLASDWRLVARAYDLMSSAPGPSRRTALRAQAKGWVPPLAWDNIDDPNESPNVGEQVDYHDRPVDEVVVLRLLSGERVPATASEKVEAVRRWVAMGYAEAELCRTHGWRPGRYSVRDDRADGAA